MKKLFKRFRDALRVLSADEYFITIASVDYSKCTPGVYPKVGPIRYDYLSNTDRDMFYIFTKDYITSNKLNKTE